jgi:hypothetical protein
VVPGEAPTMDEPRSPDRRAFLGGAAALGASLTAGCSLWRQTGAVDVEASNVADETKTVTFAITPKGADRPHTERSLELAPGEVVDRVNDGKLPTNDEYAVTVDVADGPRETFEWTDVDVERAPLLVLVDGSENVDFFLKVA